MYSRVDLEREFPLPGAVKPELTTPEAPPSRKGVGGPPTQFEWHDIAGEVFRRFWIDGPSKTNTDLANDMLKWCERVLGPDKTPEFDTLRKAIGQWLKGARAEARR